MYVVWSEGKPVSVLKATRSSMLAARGVTIAKANPASIGPKPATYTYTPPRPKGPAPPPGAGAGASKQGPPPGPPPHGPLPGPNINSQNNNSAKGLDPHQVPQIHKQQQDLLPEDRQRFVVPFILGACIRFSSFQKPFRHDELDAWPHLLHPCSIILILGALSKFSPVPKEKPSREAFLAASAINHRKLFSSVRH